MSKHTPGPYKVISGEIYASPDLIKEVRIAFMDRTTPDTRPTERDANAHLLAAAPEMLDLLYRLLPYIEVAELDDTYKPGVVRKLTKELNALINKAEGK